MRRINIHRQASIDVDEPAPIERTIQLDAKGVVLGAKDSVVFTVTVDMGPDLDRLEFVEAWMTYRAHARPQKAAPR